MTSNLPVPPLLSLVQPEREPDAEPAGTLAQREPAAPVLAGGRMSAAEQVLDMLRATVTLTLRQAKVMSRREGGLIHGLLAAKPPSRIGVWRRPISGFRHCEKPLRRSNPGPGYWPQKKQTVILLI